QLRQCLPRAAAERFPKGNRIEIEAAHQRQVGIREEPVAERLLRRADGASAGVEDDAAAGAGASVESDEEIRCHAKPRLSSPPGFAIQRGRSPRNQRSIASTTMSLWWRVTSVVAPPRCGVTTTFGSARKRLPGWSGSSVRTSRAAPAIRPA